MPTTLHPGSKSCTTVLLDIASAAINVDLGPHRTSLTNAGTYLNEANSARSAIAAPRNVTVVASMRTSDSGTLLMLGGLVTYSYRITLSTGVISCAEDGILRVAVAMPGLTGSFRKCLVHWSQRVEGVNVVSELAVYNFSALTWAFATATHAAGTPSATDSLTVCAATSGASVYTGGLAAIAAVHIGRRFRTTTEAAGDWVGDPAPPTITGLRRTPALTGPAAELGFVSEGNFAGPGFLMAGAATRAADSRCVGPFVNIVTTTPTSELLVSTPVRFYRPTPDAASGWQLCVRYLWHGFLSPKTNAARVRAHIRGFDETHAGATISPIRFRGFSLAHLPVGLPNQPAMTWTRTGIASITSVSATGVWIDLGVLQLVREPSGLSYFALGFKLEPAVGEGTSFDTAWQLNAITVDPFTLDVGGGGNGDTEGG